MKHSETVSINERVRISDRSRWWKPLSSIVFSKERSLTYTRETGHNWTFGVQMDRKSGAIIKHNYWVYYYIITAMLASIYIQILAVNLFLIIPYPSISLFFIVVSTLVFFGTFIGLMVLMGYIERKAMEVVPQCPLSESTIILCTGVPMALVFIGIAIIAQFEQRPLVMVGLSLLGIDLGLLGYFYGVSYDSQTEFVVIKTK